MEGSPVFLSYHTLLRLICCFISDYALETRNLRDAGLSFANDTRVFHVIIRSLASPSVYSFSHFAFGSRLWVCPNMHRELHTHTCTHHTLVFHFALDIQRLCILGSSILQKSNQLVFGYALDTLTPYTLFSGFTHKSRPFNHRFSDIWLSPSIPVPHEHVMGERFDLAPLVRKNQSWSQEYRKTWFGPLHCESISGQT